MHPETGVWEAVFSFVGKGGEMGGGNAVSRGWFWSGSHVKFRFLHFDVGGFGAGAT